MYVCIYVGLHAFLQHSIGKGAVPATEKPPRKMPRIATKSCKNLNNKLHVIASYSQYGIRIMCLYTPTQILSIIQADMGVSQNAVSQNQRPHHEPETRALSKRTPKK